jgi:3-oxoacyl-[acyl-carrier-protein] synthase III
MKVGIKAVAMYQPSENIDNISQGEKLNSSEDFIINKIGMKYLARKDKYEDTSDLAKKAVNLLSNEKGFLLENIECLILITQNPDNKGLPHSSAILHSKLGLQSNCAVFDVSLGCSGYVHGLSIIKSFMESNNFSNGVLVTADPYSKIVNSKDRDTALIFGDGASATWISNNCPLWDIGPFDFGIDSEQSDALIVGEDGFLLMNGRAVFNFAATRVPKSVGSVLTKANLSIHEVDLVLLHQGSKFIVETLAKRLGSEGKTPFDSENIGNTISSSIPILLSRVVGGLEKSIILSGFGVGLSWATCLLKKRSNHDH